MENDLQQNKSSIALHGIALEIFGKGVLIIGKSGTGKSELGLELIDRGHLLICDDLVQGTLHDNQVILDSPHKFGIGFLEIRGVGFVNAEYFFGSKCISKNNVPLFIVIELVEYEMLDIVNKDRLKQLIDNIFILDKEFEKYQLPVGANRNLPILVELIVKYAKAKTTGYDSHNAFIQGQLEFIQSESLSI